FPLLELLNKMELLKGGIGL
ncbi:hypothetical protein CFOL_v3_22057, partial [Cephalotus follicularis]